VQQPKGHPHWHQLARRLTPTAAILAMATACASRSGPTPSPSPDPVPSATANPTATTKPRPRPTFTPTPRRAGAPVIEGPSDGSTKFTDSQRGYSITLPPKWVVIDLTSDCVDCTLSSYMAQYPPLLETFERAASGGYGFSQRVAAVDLESSHQVADLGVYLTLEVDLEPATLTVQQLHDQATAANQQYPDASILSAEIITTSTGVPISIHRISSPSSLPLAWEGAPATTQYITALFITQDHLAMLHIVEPYEHFPELESVFDHVLRSIELAATE